MPVDWQKEPSCYPKYPTRLQIKLVPINEPYRTLGLNCNVYPKRMEWNSVRSCGFDRPLLNLPKQKEGRRRIEGTETDRGKGKEVEKENGKSVQEEMEEKGFCAMQVGKTVVIMFS